MYYVHFLNLEKRNDRWITEKMIKQNLGNKDKDIEGVKFIYLKFSSHCV
jgi:hypothetical protein